MRKLLISFLLLILLALLGTIVIYGVELGNFNLGYSVKDIMDKNDELDIDIQSLQTKINTDYLGAQSSLTESLSKLQTEKENYLSKVRYTTEEEIQKANVSEQYKISYIWTNVGSYATKNYCDTLKVQVSNGTSGVTNQYNITFTVTGTYLDISNFIYAIEKDPNLGFRIEEFSMIPNSGSDGSKVQATFMIKNIALDPTSLTTDNQSTQNTTTSGTGSSSNGTNTNTSSDNQTSVDTQNTGS